MANPNQRDPKQQGHDPLDESGSHAADEPTAVWDADSLREAGLAELLEQEEAEALAPATPGATSRDASIQIADELAPAGQAVSGPTPARQSAASMEAPAPKGMGWGAALSIALALGGAVYALIRFLK